MQRLASSPRSQGFEDHRRHPHLQRGQQPAAAARRVAGPADPRPAGARRRRRIAGRHGPAGRRTGGPDAGPPGRPAPRGRAASAWPTWTASTWPSNGAPTRSSRWTPTFPTLPAISRGCSAGWRAPTSSSGRATCPAAASTSSWGFGRSALSRSANALARTILGLTTHDATTGFRAWRRQALEAIDPRRIRSNGYLFQVEMVYISEKLGLRIRRSRSTSQTGRSATPR